MKTVGAITLGYAMALGATYLVVSNPLYTWDQMLALQLVSVGYFILVGGYLLLRRKKSRSEH